MYQEKETTNESFKTINYWREPTLALRSNEIVTDKDLKYKYEWNKTRCKLNRKLPQAGRFHFIKLLKKWPAGFLQDDLLQQLTLNNKNQQSNTNTNNNDSIKIVKSKFKKGTNKSGNRLTKKK